VLAAKKLLRDVDFLSTVSGGGYLGAFLTTAMQGADGEAEVAAPHGPDKAPVRHLRRGAKYLAASNLKERWAMVTATLAGMVLNWTAPLFLIALAALVASCLPLDRMPWGPVLASLGLVTGVLLAVYAYLMRYQRYTGGGRSRYRSRRRWLWLCCGSLHYSTRLSGQVSRRGSASPVSPDWLPPRPRRSR
jgi:hypothetical protein